MMSYSSSFSSAGHMASRSRMFSWLSGQDGLMHEQTQESSSQTVQDGSQMTQTQTKRVCRDGRCEEVVMVMEPPPMQARGMPMYNRPMLPSFDMSPRVRAFLDHVMGPPPMQSQEQLLSILKEQVMMGRPEMVMEHAPPVMMGRAELLGRPDTAFPEIMGRPIMMGRPEMGQPVMMGSPEMGQPVMVIIEGPDVMEPKQSEIIIELGRGPSWLPMGGGLGPQLKSPEPLQAIPVIPQQQPKAQPFRQWNSMDLVKFGAAFLALAIVYTTVIFLLNCRRSDAREAARERPLQALAEPLAPAPMQVMEKSADVIQDPHKAAAAAVATYLPRLFDSAIAKTEAASVRMYMSRLYTRILA